MPWVEGQGSAHRVLVGPRNNQQRVSSIDIVPHRAAEQDDAAFGERFHESGVFVPALLGASRAARVISRSGPIPDQVDGHIQTLPASSDSTLRPGPDR